MRRTHAAIIIGALILAGAWLTDMQAQNIRRGWSMGQFADGTAAAPSVGFASQANSGLYNAGGAPTMTVLGSARTAWGSSTIGLQLDSAYPLSWSGTTPNNPSDVVLARDASAVLAQRNGVNAQAFRVYNTFTDASNYERFGLNWSGSVAILRTEAAGTGTQRQLTFDGAQLNFQTAGSTRWNLTSAGWLAVTDNTYDIGASGATRPRTGYFGTSVVIGTNTTLGAVTPAATGTRYLCISTTGVISSSATACSGT